MSVRGGALKRADKKYYLWYSDNSVMSLYLNQIPGVPQYP
jgi:hypothetical protein